MNKVVGAFLSAALCGASVLVWQAPATAMPLIAPGNGAAAAVRDQIINVRAERRARKGRKSSYRGVAPPNRGYVGQDNVGSIVRDGQGYGYNRFSGQRYYSCMFDDGYGRVRPCDAGGDPQ